MKIKFSKTLAIACVLCMAFATLTAFADVTVVTTTDYDFDRHNDKNDTIGMTVTTTVTKVADGAEITYYVENAGEIVFIDQKTAEGGEAQFVFNAAYGDVINAVAKNGSDKGYTGFQNFTFGEGCNYLSNATARVYDVAQNAVYDAEKKEFTYQAKVEGPVTEYGVIITVDNEEIYLPAKGCDTYGVFAVTVQNISADEAKTITGYVK